MSALKKYHSEAMDLAERAFVARMRGKTEEARVLFFQAYELEKRAAENTPDDLEPSRSILYRSAASLALHAGELYEAEELCNQAMRPTTPSEVQDELVDLKAQIQELLREEDAQQASVAAQPIEIVGRLSHADAKNQRIRLSDENGIPLAFVIKVEGDMDVLIRDHWNDVIRIKGLHWENSQRILGQEWRSED
jgi:hypothetical protein